MWLDFPYGLQMTLTTTQNPPETLDEAFEIIHEKENVIDEQLSEIEKLKDEIAWFRKQHFGRKSEKIILPGGDQLDLFADVTADESNADAHIDVPAHKRKHRNHPGRKPLPEHLPRIDEIHDVADEEKICHCGCEKTSSSSESFLRIKFLSTAFTNPFAHWFFIKTTVLTHSLTTACSAVDIWFNS